MSIRYLDPWGRFPILRCGTPEMLGFRVFFFRGCRFGSGKEAPAIRDLLAAASCSEIYYSTPKIRKPFCSVPSPLLPFLLSRQRGARLLATKAEAKSQARIAHDSAGLHDVLLE